MTFVGNPQKKKILLYLKLFSVQNLLLFLLYYVITINLFFVIIIFIFRYYYVEKYFSFPLFKNFTTYLTYKRLY